MNRLQMLKAAAVFAAGGFGFAAEQALGSPPPGRGWRKNTTTTTTTTTAATFTVSISGTPTVGDTLTAVVA